ncbi:tetratricopeptide repeat protein [Pendulispora albinea]|uniref:DUF4034 domain-containing protein n=1 Tax=Pendulispora albinea TaxID=2741071 RepID=A0ABZ2LQJ1_9BACT
MVPYRQPSPPPAPPPPKPRIVRPWVAIAFVASVALAWGLYVLARHVYYGRYADRHGVATRQERATAIVRMAPGPIPTALPMVGQEGRDPDGYPTKHVDTVGFRTLLQVRRYRELTAYAEELQDAFERDPKNEYWPVEFGEAFDSSEADIDADLDAWVAATPESFAPYIARGGHRLGKMVAARGDRFARETSQQEFTEARSAGQASVADLERALALRPKSLSAVRIGINVARIASDRALLERMRERGIAICDACLLWRGPYIITLTPRWGGSYEKMRAFVAESPLTRNPRLRVLAGYEDSDRADLLMSQKKYEEALSLIRGTTERIHHWEFYSTRARALRALARYDEALADLDRANTLRPLVSSILAARAAVQLDRHDYLAAGNDMLIALRCDPTGYGVKSTYPYTLQGLIYEARQLEKAGQRERALDVMDLARALGPMDPTVQYHQAHISLADATTPERIAAVRARAKQNPGDYRALEQLYYALSRQGEWGELPTLWSAYIAIHPEDGRGFMKRATAYRELGKKDEALADAKRACELGNNEGCERSTRSIE